MSKPTGKIVTDRSREAQKKSAATPAPKPQAQASTGSSVGAVPPTKETAPKLTGAEATADAAKAAQGIASHYRGGWQMFLHNPCHTGNSYIDMPPASQGRIKWTFPAEGPIDSSPAIYKGAIYFGSDDGHVYAVDEQNGKLLWRSKLGDKVKSSPAIGDGMLIVGCEDKKIYGLNNRDGKVIWSFETKDRVSSSPAVYDGVAYVGGWDGNLYALDAKSGQLRWQFPRAAESSSGAQDGSGTAVGEGAGVGNDPAVANANAAGSNTQGIPQSSLGRITSSPCIAPGMVIVTAHNGNVYALSTRDGKLVWQFRTGGKLMASPMVLDHLVYFGSWD
ncbi:MAG TPA: PQQ-binding-like beta-propeller repeat protein, partial [Candidatus Obscuribacter sp.]|nr:PQQ-binding-like beta-propeller repeat protein [Candidatus Obscuribacter sp.]